MYHSGRDLTWRGNVIEANVVVTDDAAYRQRFPCVPTATSCVRAAFYFDDHQSGVDLRRNVVVGQENGVFIHFGRWNRVRDNLFINCGVAVAIEACSGKCYATFQLNSSDPQAIALRAAMAWPEWDSVWLTQYPALRSVTAYAPGYSLNNSVEVNSIINASGNTSIWNPGSWIKGSSVLSDGQRSLLPLSGNWIGSALSDAQFVSADPLQTLDFRVQQSSPIWKASANEWKQIPGGQGPRVGHKTDDASGSRRRISGWTAFKSCGAAMCPNMSKQLEHIISHADTIDTVFVGGGGAIQQYNVNHSLCFNDTSGPIAPTSKTFPWATFRWGTNRENLPPLDGDGSGRYLCTPYPDSLVTAWAKPLRDAGIAVMPIIEGGAKVWPVAGRDEGFFEVAVATAKRLGLDGWALDVEPTVNPPGSGAKYLAQYAAFLSTFSSRLAAHGLRLETAEPNGNLVNASRVRIAPPTPGNPGTIDNESAFAAVGSSGAEVGTMNTYYGVQSLTTPGLLPAEIKQWQLAVPNASLLSIGFGAIYAAWGAANCGPGGAGLNQTGCLAKSLAACSAGGVRSLSIFNFDAWGCPAVGKNGCQISGPVPPESWWPLLHEWRHKTDDLSTVVFGESDAAGGFELSNGIVRTRWASPMAGASGLLNQTYELFDVHIGAWKALADSGLGGVELEARSFPANESWTLRQKLAIPSPVDAHLPPATSYLAGPTAATHFSVTGNDTASATLSYNLSLGADWACQVTLGLAAGGNHIHERLAFVRLAASNSYRDDVRCRKNFHTAGIPNDLRLSFWRAVGFSGWMWPGASFVVQALGRWSPQSGGGSFPDLMHWSGNKVAISSEFSVAHQAPPELSQGSQESRIGWITTDDVGVGESYVLEHNLVVREGSWYTREFLEYLWNLSPPERLPLRYSARQTVDKMLYALQYTPGPTGDSGGGFRRYFVNESGAVNGSGTQVEIGFIAQAWYNYLGQIGDPNGQGRNFTLLIQHSPDWGAGMDAWSCVFMLLYRQAFGDTPDGFINRTTALMIKGFEVLPWNLEGSDTVLDGAMWEAWDAQKGMHPADFLGAQRIFWLCDSGKSGFFFAWIYELTGSTHKVLLARAEMAARFLLRIQLPSGDFAGSVYSDGKANSGSPTRPPNYAATTSASK